MNKELATLPEHMTLLEVCRLVGKRHNDAINRVMPKLLELETFIGCAKCVVNIESGKGREQHIQTYLLNRDQSLIVAARLSEQLLEKVVLRWRELEEVVRSLNTRKLSKEEQKLAMAELQGLLPEPEKGEKLNYIKANTIVNKAVSAYFGYPKLVKKDEMTDDMIQFRDRVLKDLIALFEIVGNFHDCKEVLYKKYQQPKLPFEDED